MACQGCHKGWTLQSGTKIDNYKCMLNQHALVHPSNNLFEDECEWREGFWSCCIGWTLVVEENQRWSICSILFRGSVVLVQCSVLRLVRCTFRCWSLLRSLSLLKIIKPDIFFWHVWSLMKDKNELCLWFHSLSVYLFYHLLVNLRSFWSVSHLTWCSDLLFFAR